MHCSSTADLSASPHLTNMAMHPKYLINGFPNIKLLQQICFELPIICPQNTLFRNSRMINDLPTQDHSISSIQVSVAGGLFRKKCRVTDLTPDPLGLNLGFKNHSQCFLCTVKLQKPCSMTAFCKVLLGIP